MARHITSRAFRLYFLPLVISAVLPSEAWAQSGDIASYFVFPHFVAGGSVDSGVALFNPNGSEATVTMTVTGNDGRVLPAVARPAMIAIPAGGQVAKTARELFGTELDGTLVVTSSSPGLVAYCQTFDADGTFSDGFDQPETSANLVFPIATGPGEGRVEIDLLNPNPRATSVELRLWNFNGDQLGKATVQLAVGGAYRGSAEGLFPAGTNFSGASHITAAGKPVNLFAQAQSLIGTSLLYPASGRGDMAALNAVSLNQAPNAGAIAHFRTGPEESAALSVVNLETAAADVTVTAISPSGSTLATRKLSLRGNGGYRAALQSVFASFGTAQKEGWLLIQSTGRVAAALMYGGPGNHSLSAVPMQRMPAVEFVFPQYVEGGYGSTELSFVNPTSNTSYVDVYVGTPGGATLGSTQLAVKPGEVLSRNLREILPEVTDQVGGFVYVHANEPVFAVASLTAAGGRTLSSFVPQTLRVPFRPAAQRVFAATGKVTLNGQPAPGFRIALSGPVSRATTAAADGTYAFTQLPAGQYSMSVDQFGFQFVPDEVNFQITDASKRQDFQGYTTEDGIVIQPGSLPVKSPDTAVGVFGSGFDETSRVYAGAVRLQTTYVSPTQLSVIIPAHLLAAPDRFEITVITDENGAQRRETAPFSFVAYQNRPTLTSIVTPGDLAEGNASTTILLKGTGFLEGAQVRINGTSDGIVATVVDSTQMVVDVPAGYFRQGGILPVTVENPYPANVESNIQLLTVFHPAPTIEAVWPGAVPVKLEPGEGAVSIQISGWGFRRGAVAYFNDQPLVTTYCEDDPYCLAIRLYAKVPPDLLQRSGFARVWVRNPDPSLASSESVFVRVDGLRPTITSVVPGSATALGSPFNFSMPVIVNGTNFGPQTMVRIYRADEWEVPEFSASGVHLISSTQLYATIQMEYGLAVGEWMVEVANPQPGGGQTEPFTFSIQETNFAPNPFLMSLSPDMVPSGGPSFTLTINGTNLSDGCYVRVYNTVLPTVFVSDRQVRTEVPAYLIKNAGRAPVSVTNTDGGGTSNRLFIDIR